MSGINRYTGEAISGWEDVKQGLEVCITTELGSQIMRRKFGGDVPTLQDKPGNQVSILDHFVAIYNAIRPRLVNGKQLGEPRFLLARILAKGDEGGTFMFECQGVYFPNGHLGDYSVYEVRSFAS